MAWYYWLLIIYLILINLVSIIITVYDKIAAKKHKERIPERTLLILAGMGGAVFMYLTMNLIRHKTKHMKFMIGIPVIFFVECAIVITLYILLR